MLLIVMVAAAGCSSQVAKAPVFSKSGKVKVATSFWPMYEFTQAVGGDKIDLVNMVPSGTEPHDWEPTSQHLKTLNEANLFVYNGVGMEQWVGKTLASLDNKQLVVVETAKGLDLMKGDEGGQSGTDPHVWLDPQNAIRQVQAIRDGLIQVDPAHQDAYRQNAAAYVAQLQQLDQEYQQSLANCTQKRFFTSHAAFGYLARRYGLEQHAIMGLAPDAEPTAQDLARIVAQAKADHVKYIFFETLVSDKVSRMVAGEIGAKTLVLNPFEGLTDNDLKAGKNYLSVMRENLTNLKTALECGN